VLSIDEYDVDSLLHLGIIFNSAKEYKKAYKCFHTVISIEPTNAIANYGLGKIYQLKHENYNEAIKHYNTCIEHDPTNIKAYIQIGIIYLQTNNLSKAKTYLKKAYAIDKANVECLVAIANVYHQLKEYKTCEKYLQNAYEINDSDINVLCSYGSVLFAMGKYKEAIRKYEKTLGYSKIADVHFNLGHCYFIIEKFDFAISHYISALKIKKNQANDTYYYYLACALIVVKRYNDAITALKCAIKINCKNGGYYYKLAKECGVVEIFNQADLPQMGPAVGWGMLKGYLSAKLAWNTNYNVDYLVDKFFKAQYGAGAEKMQKLYNEWLAHSAYQRDELGVNGSRSIFFDFSSSTYWSKGLLERWIDLATDAVAAIEAEGGDREARYRANACVERACYEYPADGK
jgi:tetratricopeptide (TPR) repeat protein